jgi:hypothetical protein
MFGNRKGSRPVMYQFTLKSLLVLTTLIAVLLSGYTSDWWQGLSRQDYDILSVAVRPYLEMVAPDICMVTRDTKSLGELEQRFCTSALPCDLGNLASSIPDVKSDTLRSFIENNRHSYMIRRPLDEKLKYGVLGQYDKEIDQLRAAQPTQHYLYVSRPGIGDSGKQAIVYIKYCEDFGSVKDCGDLIVLERDGGNWRATRTLTVSALWEAKRNGASPSPR